MTWQITFPRFCGTVTSRGAETIRTHCAVSRRDRWPTFVGRPPRSRIVGAVAPIFVLPMFHRAGGAAPDDMIPPMLMHAGVWMGVGTVGGLAFGIGLGGRRWIFAPLIGGA